MANMIRIRHDLKIRKSIVISYSVNMMDYLMFFQKPFKVLFHNKTMFKNVTTMNCVRVIRLIAVDISPTYHCSSPLPMIRVFARKMRVLLSFTFTWHRTSEFTTTFTRTCFSKVQMAWFCIKKIITNNTSEFNHVILYR